ncbi:pseudouridine synthase [Shewanella inventionis]|uniref:Pseudouridine synthase n=1 Tax=Shewanella inventionis TaxID=1738770 RepID=A0ABQ1IY94_9GAMM|nr:23S rRNA pseudouridine(2604) synthase RluF [Shewanella inventionis]MCL1156953.1 pseudouridine synthase [Shewanella inventionis]UAL43118.1 pseudouridine synthase [Shewanella inventionis]GGB54084.1 pseudouridine synthase [Shewanella inventionis]
MALVRISHYLALCGVASRRQSARLIDAGRVTINQHLATHTERVDPLLDLNICVDGQPILAQQEKQYWLYHKPVGVDCRLLINDPSSLIHVLPHSPRLYPAGRLDKDSRGLLLLTNDGELTQALMHPDFHHTKTYVVQVDKPLTSQFLNDMARGVSYGKVQTRPCSISLINPTTFEIVLTQGLNRQIRRMCQALGFKVIDLLRTKLMTVCLDDLPEKTMRPVSAAELLSLQQLS